MMDFSDNIDNTVLCWFYVLSIFKEEKNFVWSLWKKLQTEKPDLSSVVSLVMARYQDLN